MASKDLKTLLKNARDCIKNKDYKEAIKHCKAVLKVDKTNYNGLVFFGKCASELGQPEQALMVYKKATEVDDSQMLAWQGIAALCEKEDILLFKAELPQTYTRLLQFFESDRPKRKETAMKLAGILEKQEEMYLQAVERWEDIAFETENQDEQFGIWARIIKILEKKPLEANETQKLKETYERVVHGIWSQDHKNQLEIYFEDYIRLLKKYEGSGDKASQKQKIYEEGKLMTKLFPNSNFALELQAATFLESLTAAPSPEMSDVFQRLCHLYPSSPVGRIGLGCILFHLKEFLAAREILQQGLEVFTECPSGWLWLCKSQISLHDYQNAEKTARKGLNCTNVATETAGKELQKMLSLSRAEALQKQGQPTAATALKIYEQLLTGSESSEELCVLTGLGNVLLMLGDTEQATQICKKALLIDKTCHAALALQGQISFQEGYFDDAELRLLEAIERQQDCAFYHFLLGKLYWEMNGNLRADKKKCLAQFLKAAKLDPYYSTSFLYLGHYHYQVLKDVRKASRCYQKAFDLDSSCDNAGIALGDSLMELGDQIAALNLYKNVTAMSSPGKGKWAWLRLGLYHLKQNESTEAVTCLQSALRADPQDRHCWECLGEAYMSRGSFMAAMKAFTKATELDPSSLYCLYQLAAIKQLLSVHADAIEEYKHILQLQHDYVPALKGLGETYLNLARSALEEDFNGRAVDHVMQALHVLARGVECRPDLCCLWKLIGDCCTVIHPVSSCSISGRIPDNLTKCIPGEAGSGDVEKRHILALGSSAYSRALKLQPECGSLWGDLGLSCFQQTKILIGDEKQKMAKRAVQALKKSLTLQPANHKLWNILGVITASKEINNPGLSQHSFIMSIKTEPNNVVAWTNLGVLYLKHSKIELAHEAFKNAQALDPSYTAAWIGQASIAEIIGSEETIDLFRHTVELGSHVEGNIGYARWVCSSLLPDKSRDNHVVQEGKPVPNLSHLHAEYRKSVLQSACALSKYTDRIRNNAGAFNMLGILLEHQNLFLQAETAFASAIKLIQENQSEQCQQQQHLNVVLINHARVLCSLGRYKDAVTQYQAVKLLNEFNDLCGIGLSLFMSGQLKKSYQVYEQALQLAETDADKSCVLAAMGMLGYASNDRENARTLLLKSSQLQPACEQGLMALCALGLVSADAILAGAALGELMKRQTVSEELSANICFLFSRFYALQGDPTVGRSHIMKAVHRNPASGVLWSQLASYLLQACHDELEAAARCAEASARLGRSRSTERNLALHPAGLVGSGAFPEQVTKETQSNAMSRTRAGLVASQKAVHAHPDHVTSWAVLAAAVAAQDVSTTCEGLVRGMRSLGPRLSLFVDTTAAHEKDTLQSQPQHQLPGLVRGRTSHLDTIQSWALVHCGYCLLQTGRLQEALRHVDHALSMYNTIPQISTELHFLKAQISLASGDPLEVGLNMVQTSVLSSAAHLPNAWQVLAQVQANQGSPMAAELCYRQCLQAGIDNRGRCWRAVPLIRIAMLAVLLAQKKSTDRDRWINLSMEASNEVLKLSSNSAVAMLVQGITHFLQDNMRSSRRALQQVLESRTGASELARYWLFLLYLKKNEMSAVEQILSEVKCNNSKRLDLFFYQLAKNGSFSPLEKKRFLERCVLVNPSERSYWDLLKEYRC